MMIARILIAPFISSIAAAAAAGSPNPHVRYLRKVPALEVSLASTTANNDEENTTAMLEGIPSLSNAHLNPMPERTLRTSVDQDQFPLFDANSGDGASHHRNLAFGDYADNSFTCPLTTTCPTICAASVEECPTDARCPGTHPEGEAAFPSDHEYNLCADGTCADLTNGESCSDELESPCECETKPIACAKQVDLYPTCKERFKDIYDAYGQCLEDQEEALPQVSFTGPWFMAGYIGLAAVTVLMLVWCAWNQRWSSVEGSVAGLESASFVASEDEEKVKVASVTMGAKRRADAEEKHDSAITTSSASSSRSSTGMHGNWTQTGYKSTIVGMCLYSLVIATYLLIQALLAFLTIEYYKQQEAIVNLPNPPIFADEVQVLMAFEIVWMAGFVWCFFLKYPASIHSLFLRRCLHKDATYIAVSAPVQSVDTHYEAGRFAKVLNRMGKCFHSILSFLYSDVDQPAGDSRMKLTVCNICHDEKSSSKYFYFRMRRYIYSEEEEKYVPGCWSVTENTTIGSWLDESYLHHGLSTEEASKRLDIVGPNILDLKKPSIFGSIKNEFSKPFYLYQNFIVWTWAPFWYYHMFLVNSIVRITGGLVVAIFRYSSDMDLYRLMVSDGTAQVIRDGNEVMTMNQTDVVPGDIVRLTPGIVYFDMALLQASKVLVDESALTGEVHPCAKLALDPADSHLSYGSRKNKSSTISAGTTILECNEGIGTESDLAIVTKTGSFTAKGELLSDVLSYERHKFKFDTEVKLVLAILCIEAAILIAVVFSVIEDHWVYSWLYAMFVVSAVLPPLLPTVFVISVGISSNRLQRKGITCTDQNGILVAGKVRRAFFDKTGTLTRQGLNFVSALKGNELLSMSITLDGTTSYLGDGKINPVLQRGLAVCHTLSLSAEGNLIGPAVDRDGFAAVSDAQLLDEKHVSFEGETIEVLKKFEFDHHTMTQSVIVHYKEESIVYVKGSPEAISKRCQQVSLPQDFEEKARQSARDGIYQLAMATSTYSSSKAMAEVTREEIERELTFVGFINFQNSMKEETPTVIRELREGNVESAMITGDHVLTGIHVALKAGIIDPKKKVLIADCIRADQILWLSASDDRPVESPDLSKLKDTSLAMTGEVWRHLLKCDPNAALKYAEHTQVFGRCNPIDKVSIVSTFVELGEITLFVGDGGNDCGALKAAHVGIALSDAEASVVAPFTSLDKTISSVTQVLNEGRCALASAMSSYKYMIMYGQISSFNQVAMTYFAITFTDWCWVFIDGFWSITMAFTLPLAKAAKKLSPKRPTASLLGPHTLSSVCGIVAINFLFLVFGLVALFHQDWFQCRKWDSTDVSNILSIGDNYETSVIFIITGYQYISSAAAYNFGYTFRANWFRNYIFVFLFVLFTSFHFAATLTASKFSCIWRLNCDNDNAVRMITSTEPDPINNPWNSTVMPMDFRVTLLVLMIANLIANCGWDYFIVNKALPKIGSKLGVNEDSQRIKNKRVMATLESEEAI